MSFSLAQAQSNQWAWIAGTSDTNHVGNYGTQNVSAASNLPASRQHGQFVLDTNGKYWLFGGATNGAGTDGMLNDLWEYDTNTGFWTWVSGSDTTNEYGNHGTQGVAAPTNVPCGRFSHAAQLDSAGRLWVFGGTGEQSSGNYGKLNDLWMYDFVSGNWTWMGGSTGINAAGVSGTQNVASASNIPSARNVGASWMDDKGNFWIFGGQDQFATLNELWKYDISDSTWTWVSGTISSFTAGVYGTQGVSAAGNVPGSRLWPTGIDSDDGNLYLFGGSGIDASFGFGVLNDLWMFDPLINEWTWLSGSSTNSQPGVYGNRLIVSTTNIPGARFGAGSVTDSVGDIWIFGGFGKDSTNASNYLNDLWRYDVSLKQWTWMSGSDTAYQYGVYGTIDVYSDTTTPGAREPSGMVIADNNEMVLYGGFGLATTEDSTEFYLTDLWSYKAVIDCHVSASISLDSNVSCFGDSTGEATASATGGVGPLTFNWSNSDTDSVLIGVIAGTYTVTISDSLGCHDTAIVTITEPTQLIASASVTGTLDCFGFSDGEATASQTGGVVGYTYLWSTGETNATETGLSAGTYSVTVTDLNGCTDSASVTLSEPPELIASASVTGTLDCFGDNNGEATVTETGGTAGYSYFWNTGETNATETGLAAGTYSVTVTDFNGCTDSTSVTLTQPTQLIASASVTGTLDCFGFNDGEVTASQTGGTSTYSYLWNTGETNATETGLAAGTYSVTVTDFNGCTDSTSVVLTEPTQLVASASVTGTLDCFGFNDGEATASQTGGTPTYSYFWNTGATAATAVNLTAGTYSVTVTDFNGCTDSASVTLGQPTQLIASASVTGTLDCFGFSDGEATASQTGGTATYSYFWNTGETNATETGLSAGTYSVTVTDFNGCTDSASVTLSEPPELIASASVTGTLDCFGDNNGEATVTETGGTAGYSYFWNTGETNATETGLAAGTYSVTVTDFNGCTDSTSVTLTQPTQLVASASVTGTLDCFGFNDGEVTASQTGGTSTYSYLWNTGETNATETGLAAGTYSVTVTDFNGCTDSTSVVLTEPTQLVASASIVTPLDCFGFSDGEATASQTGGTPTYSYFWNTGASVATAVNLTAGTYSVTITDFNGCTDSASVTLSQPPQLIASASVTGTLDCFGFNDGEATASQTGGTATYSYFWNTGETNATETGLSAGTYSVTVTDFNGCTDSASVTLSEPPELIASASVTGTLDCFGDNNGEATVTETGGTAGYSYFWNTGETNATETGLAAGTYSVTVTDFNGCTDSTSVTLTQPTQLVASASVTGTLDCFGFNDGEVTASQTGGTSTYSYLWNTGETNATETGLAAGTYSVTVTDFNGCTDSTSVVLTEPTQLVASASVTGTLDCFGFNDGEATASQTGGTPTYSYFWNTGATAATAVNLTAGTYSVTITDFNGCTDSASVTLGQPTQLIASASVTGTLDCFGFSDGEATASQTGGISGYTYMWNTGETNANETGLSAGTYSVTVTDFNGCTDSASVTLSEPPELIATATVNDSLDCFGDTDGEVMVTETGGTAGYSYFWNTGETNATETGLSAGTYSVTVTDFNGCTDSTSVTLTEPVVLVANSTLDSNVSCNGFADGGATATNTGGTSPYTYTWSNGNSNAAAFGLSADTYSVTVTDANGCTDSASITITEPTQLVASATLDSNANCHSSLDGGVTASAIGGTINYTFSWSNSAITAVLSGIAQGTYSVTVTDANGCTDSASVFVDAIDNIDPVAIAQSVTVYLDANGEVIVDQSTVNNGSSDNCGIDSIYIDLDTLTCSNIGSNSVILTVVDSNGNSDTASAIITLVDTVKPIIVGCPGNMVVSTSATCDFILDDYTVGMSFSDSCGIQTITQTPAPLTSVSTGTTIVQIIATDVNGNADTCSFDILVNDSTPPIITCLPDTTIFNDPGVCGAVFNFSVPNATDNCTIDTVLQISGLASGSLFPIDTTLMTFVALDDDGNSDTCSFNVIVIDSELPIITCINDTVICQETYSYNDPVASDNCGIQSITRTSGLSSGSIFPLGVTTIKYVVVDSSGNIDSCSFNVTRDETPTVPDAGIDQNLCNTSDATLNANVVTLGNASWTSLGSANLENAGLESSNVSALIVGENQFVWTVVNGACAPNSDTVSIFVDALPTLADAGVDINICDELSATLNGNDPEIGIGSWSTISSADIENVDSASSLVENLPSGSSVFVWTITNGVCPASVDSVRVQVGLAPIVSAGPDIYTQGISDIPVGLSLDQPASIQWEPASLVAEPTSDSTLAFITESTDFIVTAINDINCVGIDTVSIIVLANIEINTAFTPNGDNINDFWDIEGSEFYPEMVVRVFNRWGSRVFESDAGYRTKFDGTFNGNLLPAASYYYIIEFNDNITEPRDGNISIIY